MRKLCAVVLLATLASPVLAQQSMPYSPPDAELWTLMGKAFDDLPMSFASHQQIQQIMANVQREAQIRAARANAEKPEKPQ